MERARENAMRAVWQRGLVAARKEARGFRRMAWEFERTRANLRKFHSLRVGWIQIALGARKRLQAGAQSKGDTNAE